MKIRKPNGKELEKYLGNNVIIKLIDNSTIKGRLCKTIKDYYTFTVIDDVLSSIKIFKVSHIETLELIEKSR